MKYEISCVVIEKKGESYVKRHHVFKQKIESANPEQAKAYAYKALGASLKKKVPQGFQLLGIACDSFMLCNEDGEVKAMCNQLTARQV